MFYDIVYMCPDCGGVQLIASHIQLDSADYDGFRLTDFYFEDSMNELIKTTERTCATTGNSVPVKAIGFYVKIVKPPSRQ